MVLVHDNDLAYMDVAVCLVICRSRNPPDPCSRRQPFIRMDSWDTSRNLRQRFNNFSAVGCWLYHSMGHCTEGIYTKELLSSHKSGPGDESADAASAKVATLSDHPFEAPRADLSPVPTAGGATGRSAPAASLPVISSVLTSSEQRSVGAGAGLFSTGSGHDPVRDLHNCLQRYRDSRGNLTRSFSWLLEQEGPDGSKVHYATAKREPLDYSDD